ncbi:tail fiber domain-containing protein [Chitinophaga qingshengii]|uniref:Tail fiber domain-containing protein n=1 Tax=Chitinophaga qingshengii TaxID=1569794 RepID=A0ABR7TGF2_9BACT|nr:tail fiber domain-containing protein [Chitinophaga qingshengii]MBC9929525.1 tail fiber domain-containing protein [Chitinophaga qingshengii]
MKKLLLLLLTGWTSTLCAQQIYQIRADSVRIYNVCDTAELIIENRTQGVNGFLYNKGAGRTEFRKVRLEKIGDTQIAITGQDTLDLGTLPGIGGIDTVYREGDNIVYRKRGKLTQVYAPFSPFYVIPAGQTYGPEIFNPWKVTGFGAYHSPDMPLTSEQSTGISPATRDYYVGHTVLEGNKGYQMAVNWDTEDLGVRGAFIRGKDDNRTTWSPWRELVFKDYADRKYLTSEGAPQYIWNQKNTAQKGALWVSDHSIVGGTTGIGSVELCPGLTTESGYISLYEPSHKRVGYIGAKQDRMFYNAEIGNHNFAQQIDCDQMGRFKGWYNSGEGKSMEVGTFGGGTYLQGYDRSAKTYLPTYLLGSEINISSNTPDERKIFGLRTNTNVYNFGSWILDGSWGYWSGLNFSYGSKVPSILFDKYNNGGFYQQTTQKWILLWNDSIQTWTTNDNVLWHAGNLNPQVTAVANSAALRDGNGNLTANGFFQGSKAILKKDIHPFRENALSLLNNVSIQQFIYKDDKEENVRVGIIADNTDWHFSTKKRDRFDTNSSLAITMKAVQELSAQNEALKQEVAELKALVKQLLAEKK